MKSKLGNKVFITILTFIFLFSITTFNVNCDAAGKTLKVHYIDVGKADSILIQSSGSNMLIDAGNRNDDVTVINYLKSQGVKKLDIIIGTHPHEDHIGGMDEVIKAFKVDKIIMPKVTTTTRTFKDLILAIKDKGLKITTPVPGTSFKLGDAAFNIIAPNSSSYGGLNNYSVVIKLIYGKTSFLFEGDAEAESEQEMLNKKYDIRADVLKVGHHGSRTSTTQGFLDKVNPRYAIISCGKGNDYGHPNQETISKLMAKKVTFYRTDINGTIVFTSDGNKLSLKTTGSSKPNN